MGKKDVILQRSHELFLRHGVVRVTMDLIADQCGVSKKTIYHLFENKDNLLYQVVMVKSQETGDEIVKYARAQPNALESINVFLDRVYAIFKNGYLQEVKRLYPKSYQLIMELREALIQTFMEENISRGKQEGIYRPDLNVGQMSKSYHQMFTILLSSRSRVSSNDPIKFLNHLFTHRLLSESGLDYVGDQNTL